MTDPAPDSDSESESESNSNPTHVAEAPSERTMVRRGARRSSYDSDVVRSVIDATPLCHLAVATRKGPLALPMAHGRIDDQLYLHGAVANGVLNDAIDSQLCVTFTQLDALVVARSAFHNSMNYRCVVVLGAGRRVAGEEKVVGLRAVADHIVATWDAGRPPTESEIRRTLVVSVSLSEASAKIRTGDPIDEPEDLDGPWWAGTVELQQTWGQPVHAADLRDDVDVPAALVRLGG